MRSLSKSKWMEAVQSYVLYFFFYSVLGWLYEVFLEVVVYRLSLIHIWCWTPSMWPCPPIPRPSRPC